MNLESANLILRTSSVAVGADKDANRTSVTWSNINMKATLGTLYNKYKRYKMCLTSYCNINTTTIAAPSDRLLLLNMKGLQWQNQTFDSVTNTNRDTCIISTVGISSNNAANYNFTGEIGWVFMKPVSDNVSITISLTRASDNLIGNINYGESVYCFSIYGVDDE